MRVQDLADHRALLSPDDECATDGLRSVSWLEMSRWSNRVAALLADSLAPGERFGVLARNSLEWLAIYLGGFKAGVVIVPLNFRLAPPEWAYILNDAGARLVIVDEELRGALSTVLPDTMVSERIVFGPTIDGWSAFADVVGRRPPSAPERPVHPSDIAYQMYTSGTTGRPKGALLSHHAVTGNVFQLTQALDVSQSRYLGIMPLYHAAAAVSVFTNFATGTASHIVRDFDPAETVRLLDEARIGFTTIAPAMIGMLLAVPGIAERRFPYLDLMLYGASAIAPGVLRRAMSVFGCDFCQGYGMTETTAGLTTLSRADHRRVLDGEERLLRSAGRPLPGTELRVVDAAGTPVATGTVGEIVVRGPQVMDGYWNLAEASAQTLRGGWMHTGDAGHLDADGYLYISDRITDMYVSGGENVYPREVEDVLFGLDGVADAAVIGVPDDRWGEIGKAIVVAAPGASLDEAGVIAFCRGRLAGFKCPTSVEFRESLPRNATGKVLKRELRSMYWKDLARTVN